jgi:redox-sensitive bicupin YhaK (pirin superfamily)
MITLRRNTDRHHVRRGKHDSWFTFDAENPPHTRAGGFEVLFAFDEMKLPPGGVAAWVPREDAEIVTYVCEGALAQEDSSGHSGVLHAGEFQTLATGKGIRRKETNASGSDGAHFFRISLRSPEVGLERIHEQRRFGTAQRRNALCVIASPDGRKGSLRIRQDALVFSSVLEPGRHVIHELFPERRVWLHVISGEAALQEFILSPGDGVGVTAEPTASFTVHENTEILLVDLPRRPSGSPGDGSAR